MRLCSALCHKSNKPDQLVHVISLTLGTFGQEGRWRLGDPATYQHPLSPSDVLLDPQTVPEIESPEEEAQDTDKTVETQRSLHEQRQSSALPLDITDVDSGEEQVHNIDQSQRSRVASFFKFDSS